MMRSAACDFTTSTARAEALFASVLQRATEPCPMQVHQAIVATARARSIRGRHSTILTGCRGYPVHGYRDPDSLTLIIHRYGSVAAGAARHALLILVSWCGDDGGPAAGPGGWGSTVPAGFALSWGCWGGLAGVMVLAGER